MDLLPGPPLPLLASGNTAGPPACWARDALLQGWPGWTWKSSMGFPSSFPEVKGKLQAPLMPC